eukprot:gene10328-59711_t
MPVSGGVLAGVRDGYLNHKPLTASEWSRRLADEERARGGGKGVAVC